MKYYGWIGIFMIILAEINLLFTGVSSIAHELGRWTTPVCWWGYIFFIDAVILRIKGNSLIHNKPKEFITQLIMSVVFWVVFELYNLYLQNWEYINLHEQIIIRYTGYVVSFATIMPGMFLTAELLETLGVFKSFRISRLEVTSRMIYLSVITGILFLVFPLMVNMNIARYLFMLIWLGFIFLLEPIVFSSGGNSLLKDLETGTLNRILCLAVSGLICGFLWEFWNYWSVAKWVYKVPFTSDIKIFEMPLAGFLGFIPFAWEYFIMYSCFKLVFQKSKINTGFFRKEVGSLGETTIY